MSRNSNLWKPSISSRYCEASGLTDAQRIMLEQLNDRYAMLAARITSIRQNHQFQLERLQMSVVASAAPGPFGRKIFKPVGT